MQCFENFGRANAPNAPPLVARLSQSNDNASSLCRLLAKLIHISPSYWTILKLFSKWELYIGLESNPMFYTRGRDPTRGGGGQCPGVALSGGSGTFQMWAVA